MGDIDTFVIGAGVIGSSVAMHLVRRLGNGAVRVIDFDLDGALSSSERNAGGVRATWNQPINIRMGKATIDYFSRPEIRDELGYRDCGYLWLLTPDRMARALEARERQLSLGWPVEAWDVPELRRRVPFIDKTDDLAGAVFGPRDGLVNSNRVKNHFREQARAAGAVFEDRKLLRSVSFDEGAGNFKLVCESFPRALPEDLLQGVLTGAPGLPGTSTVEYRARRVVNCAGAWAAQVASLLGYASPTVAVRRQVCIFDCRDVDLTAYGMIVDSSGVYFHPEAANGLAGFANHQEPSGFNFGYSGEEFFMEEIWPALYERASAFERLRHLTGWAGLYEVSPDESAILGPVVALERTWKGGSGRVFEAHSFSGHGVLHSYAAGLALADRICGGRYQDIDASELGGERFENGKLVREDLVI